MSRSTASRRWPSRSEERRVGKECRSLCDWSSDVCSSDLIAVELIGRKISLNRRMSETNHNIDVALDRFEKMAKQIGEHTSELQSHSDLHSFPTRRSSDLIAVELIGRKISLNRRMSETNHNIDVALDRFEKMAKQIGRASCRERV